jgi:hypothetical protein
MLNKTSTPPEKLFLVVVKKKKKIEYFLFELGEIIEKSF